MINNCSMTKEEQDLKNSDATKVRVDWKIGNASGHGSWFDITSIDQLQNAVDELNKKYGKGTHWLVFNT